MPIQIKNTGIYIRRIPREIARGITMIVRGLITPVDRRVPVADWWRRPGLGIMYQVEYRTGMDWDRDYTVFNREMTDSQGRLGFNGPFCRIEEWVELSREASADYHIMEAKWHDGICYFDTALTDWKTGNDYCREFARMSREAGIPFMYYYSSIFDHNPKFDSIQPRPDRTASFIGMGGHPEYEGYLRGQYAEIMNKYRPDGMWIDWYWPDSATDATIDFFRTEHPELVLAFNMSSIFPTSYDRIDYTSGEAHDLDGALIRFERVGKQVTPVFCSAWKWSTLGRRLLPHPFEVIAPAGRWWQDPSLRDDQHDLLRMAAIVMASGARFCTGATAQLDGSIYPDQVQQLEMLGDWYGPRKYLFRGAVPLPYRGRQPRGMRVRPRGFRMIACRLGGDVLLHLVNMKVQPGPLRVRLSGEPWRGIDRAYLEPGSDEVVVKKSGGEAVVDISASGVDEVDTILRFEVAST